MGANFHMIRVPLPAFWADAAQPVIDLLMRGYGLGAESRVFFAGLEEKGSLTDRVGMADRKGNGGARSDALPVNCFQLS